MRTVAVVPPDLVRINTPQQLEALRKELGCRVDWHEPDEQEVNAEVVGNHLDNAMGPGSLGSARYSYLGVEWALLDTFGELCVVITHDAKPVASVNVATLLAWGSQLGRLEP